MKYILDSTIEVDRNFSVNIKDVYIKFREVSDSVTYMSYIERLKSTGSSEMLIGGVGSESINYLKSSFHYIAKYCIQSKSLEPLLRELRSACLVDTVYTVFSELQSVRDSNRYLPFERDDFIISSNGIKGNIYAINYRPFSEYIIMISEFLSKNPSLTSFPVPEHLYPELVPLVIPDVGVFFQWNELDKVFTHFIKHKMLNTLKKAHPNLLLADEFINFITNFCKTYLTSFNLPYYDEIDLKQRAPYMSINYELLRLCKARLNYTSSRDLTVKTDIDDF
jgi:hypothetical protein